MTPCLRRHGSEKISAAIQAPTKNPHQLLLERVTSSQLVLANLFSARKLTIKSAPLRQNSTVHPALCQGKTVYLSCDFKRTARADGPD